MSEAPPVAIYINRDDYHAVHVGRTVDGRQFFLTTPSVPADGDDPGREFIALYLFDVSGQLLEARIDDMGPRAELDDDLHRARYQQRLAELGKVRFRRIQVRPFQVERFGITFGLIPHPPDEADGEDATWTVTVEPGDYMAFYPPWNGEYDT